MEKVHEKIKVMLEDWSNMQKTTGDEGADWAERFEQHFYEFIEELKEWFNNMDHAPKTIEEAEDLAEINDIEEMLPGPLQLNFLNELELIIEGDEQTRYD